MGGARTGSPSRPVTPAHEARTSIAAYAALAATGPYTVASSFYEPIPDSIAGFAVTTAQPA